MLDLNSMNDAQRKAVTHTGGPLLVLAGPGSGKTFTITRRILYLIEHGVPPERILVITFTKEAALSMQRRFQETSKVPQPVNFGTFHSVFFQILRKSNVLKSTELLSNSEKKNLLIPILQKNHTPSDGDLSYDNLREDAVTFLAAASFYKNTLDADHAARKAPPWLQEKFIRLLEEYQRAVRVCGKLDFDDMLCECMRMLSEDVYLREEWQGRFDHILIDEFQDINPVQYEVIKLLAGKNCSIFAVGDDDQSIYGFRGSQPECLKRFEREYTSQRLLLDINYRSNPEIVNASLAVISENKERFVKELRADPKRIIISNRESTISDKGKNISDKERAISLGDNIKSHGDKVIGHGEKALSGEEKVRLLSFEESEEQYIYLIDRLGKFLSEHKENDGAECAILFRTNSGMQKLALRLRAAGIRYEMGERMQSIYQHFIVRDVMAYLTLASGDWNRETLLLVVNKPSRYVSREAVGNGVRSVLELQRYYSTKTDMPEKTRKSILCALQSFGKQLDAIGRLSPGLAVTYVLKAVGYERYLRHLAGGDQEKWEEWREIMEWLKTDAFRFSNLREWKEVQELHALELERGKAGSRPDTGKSRQGAVRDNAPGLNIGSAPNTDRSGGSGKGRSSGTDTGRDNRQDERQTGLTAEETAKAGPRIRLMTVHGSKGLEFDTVILPDCNETVFPHGRFQTNSEVEEERRIFYVAMTRAKENLELLYLTGTGERSRPPSRFLKPLLQDHSSTSSSNSQLSRYSSKASATFSYSSSSSIKVSSGSSLGSSGFSL